MRKDYYQLLLCIARMITNFKPTILFIINDILKILNRNPENSSSTFPRRSLQEKLLFLVPTHAFKIRNNEYVNLIRPTLKISIVLTKKLFIHFQAFDKKLHVICNCFDQRIIDYNRMLILMP